MPNARLSPLHFERIENLTTPSDYYGKCKRFIDK